MTIQSITGSSFSGGDVSAGSEKVYQNYLMPTLKLYDAKVSINHWQLRDCVKCSSTGLGSVYYIYDHSIRTLDTRSTAAELQNEKMERRRRRSSLCGGQRSDPWRDHRAPSELVVQFDYKPRCFRENGGLIACGGLISSDDIGSTVSRSGRHEDSDGGGQSTGVLTPSQVEPIRLANSDILTDYSFYGDQQSWKGILALYNMENGVSLTYKLGQYINNCVELYQRTSQQYDLYTCNNDSHLYQCDVSNRGVELTRRYSDLKFALNCSAISHDGKTMVVSGDSSKFAVYRQNELSGCFSLQYDAAPEWGSKWSRTKCVPRYAAVDRSEVLDRIYDSPGGDNGFYTSYSENDVHMATIFQNGLCLVYDMRKMDTPLAEIPSTRRHAQNGSFRVCKFSRSFDDLLFISEHQSHVHVVDTRNLMNHQVIVIPDKVRSPDENLTPSPNSGVSRSPPAPSIDDPCVTRATRLPIRSLEPEVLPYPDVAQYSNNFQNVSSDEDAIDQLSSGVFQNRRRRSTFRVRRYSTSSIINSNYPRALEDIDPSILDHHYTQHNYRAVDNYNYVNDQPQRGSPARVSRRVLVPGRSRRAMAVEDIDDDTLEEDNGPEDEDDNPMMGYAEAYNEINEITHGSQFRFENVPQSSAIPRRQGISMALTNILNRTRDSGNRSSRTPAFSTASGSDLFEENSISGIDWVQDQEGSSLIIGTDYGIIKWNINSWARRSFPCYDFC